MYKLLLILTLLLLFNGCSQQVQGLSPQMQGQTSPYSLEALDAQYHQGQ